MKFDVTEAVNGFTVKVDEGEDVHVARTTKEVAAIVVKSLSGEKPVPKPARKPRGKNKKKAAVAANSDALAGLS